VTFIDDSLDYFTTGFSKYTLAMKQQYANATGSQRSYSSLGMDLFLARSGDRQIRRWDARSLATPVHVTSVGNAPGVLVPTMDSTLGVLYIAAKVSHTQQTDIVH